MHLSNYVGIYTHIYIYLHLEPNWPPFLKGQPSKNKAFSNQNKGHLGSRYTYKRSLLKNLPGFHSYPKKIHLPPSGRFGEAEALFRTFDPWGSEAQRVWCFFSLKNEGFIPWKWMEQLGNPSRSEKLKKSHFITWQYWIDFWWNDLLSWYCCSRLTSWGW